MDADTQPRTGLRRWLLVSQLLFNIGFYLVLPFLAAHLADDLNLSGLWVGLVLGIRTASQQGLFVVGGWATDRFGPRRVAVLGCLVRVAGFLLLGLGDDLLGVLAGAVLTGVAGALFSPAIESALAREAGRGHDDRARGVARREVFARFAVTGEIGAMLGPLLGSVVLGTGFRTGCLVAAGLFSVIAVLHHLMLPAHGPAPRFRLTDLRPPRRLWVFVAAYSTFLLGHNQLYLLLPTTLGHTLAPQAVTQLTGVLFAVGSVLVVLGQVPLNRGAEARLHPVQRLLVGFGVMGVAAAGACLAVVAGVPVVAAGAYLVAFTLGQMVATPVAAAMVARLGGEEHLGSHLGLLGTAGGITTLLGTPVLGALSDLHLPLAWGALALLLLTSAAVLRRTPAPPGAS